MGLYPQDSLVGWKVGATNQKALTALGLSEPLRGPLLSNYVHKHEAVLQWSEMGCSLLAAEVKFDRTMFSMIVTVDSLYRVDTSWTSIIVTADTSHRSEKKMNSNSIRTFLQVEFGFQMGSSLPERSEPYSEDEVWASVSHVIPAIEVSSTSVRLYRCQ